MTGIWVGLTLLAGIPEGLKPSFVGRLTISLSCALWWSYAEPLTIIVAQRLFYRLLFGVRSIGFQECPGAEVGGAVRLSGIVA